MSGSHPPIDWSRLEVVTPANILPVSLAEVKAHCRIDGHVDDHLLLSFIESAVRIIDGANGIGFAMMKQRWRYPVRVVRGFNIYLPGRPIHSTPNVVFTYTAKNENSQTTVNLDYESKNIGLEPDTYWPVDIDYKKRVFVEYDLGVDSRADVPADLRLAIKIYCDMQYNNRAGEDASMKQLNYILNRYRLGEFGA